MDDFYVVLPSNSIPSKEIYPENQPSHFRLRLAQPLELHGSWEVGISEIHLPFSWYNIDVANNSFIIVDSTSSRANKQRPYGDPIKEIISNPNRLRHDSYEGKNFRR